MNFLAISTAATQIPVVAMLHLPLHFFPDFANLTFLPSFLAAAVEGVAVQGEADAQPAMRAVALRLASALLSFLSHIS